MSEGFNVPILFLIFNRLSTEQHVFNQIRKIKPCKLYISADGPRDYVDGEKALCEEARSIVNQIDWDCEVHTRFLDENLGCAKAISSGITWFFSHEPEGIILEDDCVPHPDFFKYCEELLHRYQDNTRIMCISGDSLDTPINNIGKESYIFSRQPRIWGWATWKRAWDLYDLHLSDWKESYKKIQTDPYYDMNPLYREERLMKGDYYHHSLNPDTWDSQWHIIIAQNRGLSVIPRKALVSNIGDTGAHYSKQTDKTSLYKSTEEIDSNGLIHPHIISENRDVERIIMDYSINKYKKYKIALSIGCIMRRCHILPTFWKMHPVIVGTSILKTIRKINQ